MAPPSIDVLKCSAEELSSYLLEHRFENDGMETTTFLLEATTTLPNADVIAAQIQEQTSNNDNENIDNEDYESSPKKKSSKTAAAESSSSSTTSTKNDGNLVLGKAHHSEPIELSMINPRGKFNVTLHEGGIHAMTVKNPLDMIIPAGSVRNIIVFPKPNDCLSTSNSKKKGGAPAPAPSPMMLLCFHHDDTNDDNGSNDDDDNNQSTAAATTKGVTFKGKPLTQICLPVPASLAEGLKDDDDDDEEDVVQVWIRLVCRSLKLNSKTSVYSICNPAFPKNKNSASSSSPAASAWGFKSHSEAGTSTTSDGMPFVKCYYGVQDGCLFPMKEGLLFFKPPLFVPRSNLHSIACGRGSGSSSRYVDMNIQTNDETAIEFTNIERQEMGVLNNYIHNVLIPAMQRDAVQQKETKDNSDDNDDETKTSRDDDDDDDDEVVVEAEAAADGDDDDEDEAVAEVEVDNDDESDEVEVVQIKAGRGCRSKRRAAFEAIQQTKQHYLQKNGAMDDSDEDDDDIDDPYTFQPAHDEYDQSDDDDGDVVSEEEEGENEGEAMDEEEDGDHDDAEVVPAEEDETEEDDEDEVEEVSPPKGKRRKR